MSLPDEFGTAGVDTAATDGRTIKWNAEYVDTLTDPELRFVLLHETLHCAHQHMWRLPCDERGNIAGDHAINLTLQGIAGISMPDGGLCDPAYAGMAEEDILGALPVPDPDPQPGDGDQGSESGDSGAESAAGGQPDPNGTPGTGAGKPDPCGSFSAPAPDPAGSPDPAAQAQADQALREAWETRVIQAAQAQQALGVGSVPGDMARVLERIKHQGVDWRRELADFVHAAMSTRNDWSRSSRRHAWQPVIYPRKRTNELGTVIFARDTSGSVDDRTLSVYAGLIADCMSETGCDALVLDCDPVPLRAKGGGGTDFRPVFNRADEMVAAGEHVAGVVYLTDLYGPQPDASELATLWLCTSGEVGKFGRTVRIES
jgi:predicted metal-dependent peptidase